MALVALFSIFMLCFEQSAGNLILRSSLETEELVPSTRAARLRQDDQLLWSGVCSTGQSQSPIDLLLSDAEVVHYEALKFNNYECTGPVTVDYDGHSGTVRGFLTWDHPPSITGGDLGATYFLRQLHFHWNSEHAFNRLYYSAELHLVHISERYDPLVDKDLAGNVAVVAVPFQVHDSGEDLEGIDQLFLNTNTTGSEVTVPSFSPSVLLPTDTMTFFRYSGSLTTHPCTEGVTWTVLSEPVLISAKQLAMIKGASASDEGTTSTHARPVQLMNGRKLFLNKLGKPSTEEDMMSRILVIFALMVLLMVAPPILIMWLIYRKSTLPNANASTTSATPSTEAESDSREARSTEGRISPRASRTESPPTMDDPRLP